MQPLTADVRSSLDDGRTRWSPGARFPDRASSLEGETPRPIVRSDPFLACAAYIGVVGHVARDELLRWPSATELDRPSFTRALSRGADARGAQADPLR